MGTKMDDLIKSINKEEYWKDLVGLEEFYSISNLGRVLAKSKIITCKDNRKPYERPAHLLKQSVGSHGYLMVGLNDNVYLVHRLVAQTFIPNPNNLPCVNHIDENKLNNSVANLEWCSYKYNNEYGSHNEFIIKKGHIFSNTTIDKMRVAKLGTAWITDGKQSKLVKKSKLNNYLSNGWTLGRKIK